MKPAQATRSPRDRQTSDSVVYGSEENTCDSDNKTSNLSEVSAHESRNSDKEPNNSDDIEAWDSANEHLFRILRLTTTGAARGVL